MGGGSGCGKMGAGRTVLVAKDKAMVTEAEAT